MKGSVLYSDKELLAAAYSFYRKLKISNEYESNRKFSGEVTLMKATDNFLWMDHEYGLSKVLPFSYFTSLIDRAWPSLVLARRADSPSSRVTLLRTHTASPPSSSYRNKIIGKPPYSADIYIFKPPNSADIYFFSLASP